ncbi:DNA ligase [Arthrobacter phage DrManhattan]|uniref:DNA ligase n=1 Tax=Arthrobacter phage DrManhattan TaxID=2419955 RepID=A0A3G2KFJ0_9CAUD|nr:DNA ligase [Arthrobacter phage DrManhattan]AYN57762.1 DNA ligase [Arthrobacter phage DrManhattan]
MNRDLAYALIERRRRQILVHSILYYKLDRPLIADHVYDKWAQELIRLQTDYPDIAAHVGYHDEAFQSFTSSTGFDLPLDDPAANRVARDLLTYSERTTK